MGELERAIIIATNVHDGKVDKGGHSYILHPLRVMMAMNTHEERLVAIMHDVIEDDPHMTLEVLSKIGFDSVIIDALDSITRRAGEDYRSYIVRVSHNEIGAKVKCVDLRDNLDRSRIPYPMPKDFKRWMKYEEALAFLESADRNKSI